MKAFQIGLFALLVVGTASAQEQSRPRVFITQTESWETSGGSVGGGRVWDEQIILGRSSGGARPQTAEIIKTFGERCSEVVVTVREENADYTVMLEHEGGKAPFQRDNKFVLINLDGEVISSGSTRSLGNAVKDSCQDLMTDWNRSGRLR